MKKILTGLILLGSISTFAGEIHSNCELSEDMRNKAINRTYQVGFPSAYSEAGLRIKAGALKACIKVEGDVQYLVTTWKVGSSNQETVQTTEVFVQE